MMKKPRKDPYPSTNFQDVKKVQACHLWLACARASFHGRNDGSSPRAKRLIRRGSSVAGFEWLQFILDSVGNDKPAPTIKIWAKRWLNSCRGLHLRHA
jgi:hypothetical protein